MVKNLPDYHENIDYYEDIFEDIDYYEDIFEDIDYISEFKYNEYSHYMDGNYSGEDSSGNVPMTISILVRILYIIR